MKLYVAGYSHLQEPGTDHPAPICILEANTIRILCASWCDIVIACADTLGAWTFHYRGASLTPEQQEHMANSVAIQEATKGGRKILQFFGSTLHEGLRGYFTQSSKGTDSELCIFSTDVEVEAGAPLVRTSTSASLQQVSMILMDSAGQLSIGLRGGSNTTRILRFKNLSEFAAHLEAQPESPSQTEEFAPFGVGGVKWCTNATTSTALSSTGQIFTSSRDLRFSECLGRTPVNTSVFEEIPYFSEICVQTISSGGYISGAVSTDGELFLWGQSSVPGYEGRISALEESLLGSDDVCKGGTGTGVTCSSDQDEMIKCLDVYIDGMEARIQSLAIGHGHVLVAAEVCGSNGLMKRAVLGAGLNSNGQLGIHSNSNFLTDFEEIPAFRDMSIDRLVARGWSTYVVTR